jgi:serine/threonine-protein kinase RsbT
MEIVSEKRVEIRDEGDIVVARKTGRDMAQEVGFRAVDCTKVATAISELARNIFLYAQVGTIVIRIVIDEDARKGIQIAARDSGPGIKDLDLVMRDGYTTSKGLGLGLPGTKRLMDDFELESESGQGTEVRVGKWLNG